MNEPLQIMFYGEGIGEASVNVKGLDITAVHKADSPNYLFVDVNIPSNAKAGEYTFNFKLGNKTIKYKYLIENRRKGAADVKGFDSSDLIYLIMPDRFANGNPANDSMPSTIEKGNRNDANGRHGGDIQGIIDHLDYLESLGVTAVWNTPLLLDNEARTTYHGYACADYYNIDPRYGSNEEFRNFVDEAHKRGIKVIMDFVTNHCGTAHWWMKDLPFKDWVNPNRSSKGAMSAYSDPYAAQIDADEFSRVWFAPSMPDMNMSNPFVRKYFTQCAIWWVEWSGLDSFRVDTFPYNDKLTMSQWCAGVRKEYPNISIVGECWINSPSGVSYWDGNKVNYDGYSSNLTSVMDFPLQSAIVNALKPKAESQQGGRGGSIGNMSIYNIISQDYLYPKPETLLLFASNHDTNRIADDFQADPKRTMLAFSVIATVRGIPQLYYGDEYLAQATKAERIGDGQKRSDFPGGWTEDEADFFHGKGMNADQKTVQDYTKALFNWRKGADVIHHGKTLHFRPVSGPYVYFRYNDDAKVMVAVNATEQSSDIDWDRISQMVKAGEHGKDVISGKTVNAGEKLTLEPMSSIIVEW